MLLDTRIISHYSWYDNENFIFYGVVKNKAQYYILNISSGICSFFAPNILDKYGDGHPSFSPDRKWLITDSYPDTTRKRHLLLYNIEDKKLIEIGAFYDPFHFRNEKRCDLHPRWSPDGNLISIDSAYTGKRNTYIIDIRNIIKKQAT